MATQRPSNIPEDDWNAVNAQLALISGNGGGGIPLDKLINAKPEDLGNDANLELLWAEKAFKHAETFFKILQAMPDKKKIKLTQIDEHIYQNFRIHFPADQLAVGVVDEEAMKGAEGKLAWRAFCNEYENNEQVKDFNMGTLLRLDASKDYEPDNTCIVPRIQFFAIEIARLREGCNDGHRKQ